MFVFQVYQRFNDFLYDSHQIHKSLFQSDELIIQMLRNPNIVHYIYILIHKTTGINLIAQKQIRNNYLPTKLLIGFHHNSLGPVSLSGRNGSPKVYKSRLKIV